MSDRSIGKSVKILRKQRGLTQAELAKHSGVGLRFIRDLEQGRRPNASVSRLNNILALFDHQLDVVPTSCGTGHGRRFVKNKRTRRDRDMERVLPALERAAKRAREIAEATNTPLVIMENGRVVNKRVRNGKIDSDP